MRNATGKFICSGETPEHVVVIKPGRFPMILSRLYFTVSRVGGEPGKR